eukprot:TRINITY_DN30482_c0_g1_i1.p1 TRINITY_DN30482_c0_g1~~TRINITY_DN30482_c0_g1_i1.p1  ORF type:complete len:109 (-),score=9.73 TRINITY_DN30482_c0_g1_i1:67-393(-)
MIIFFKTYHGETICVRVERTESIESVKAQIQSQEGIPIAKQRILFAGQELDNSHTVADYNIQNESTALLDLRPKFDLTQKPSNKAVGQIGSTRLNSSHIPLSRMPSSA